MCKSLRSVISVFAAGLVLAALAPSLAFAAWEQSGDKWWYSTDSGWYADEDVIIDTYCYSFDSDGYMITGWLIDQYGDWAYADESGAFVNNQWIGDSLIIDGYALYNDWWYCGDQFYYFDKNGYYVPNYWSAYPNGWCMWLGDQTWAQDCFIIDNGDAYHFDSEGYMDTGWVYLPDNNEWRYFDSTGKLVSSEWIDGKYYVDIFGIMATSGVTPDGYRIVDGAWDGQDKIFSWKQSANGKWWIQFNDGTYATGLMDLLGAFYNFDDNGYMTTGWYLDEFGHWYYYHEDGSAAFFEWIDSTYFCDYDGAMVTDNFIETRDGDCYVDQNGAYDRLLTKWVREF